MYKIIRWPLSDMMSFNRTQDNSTIPIDQANTDYQRFKLDLTNGAELQDADGNVMSEAQVQAFLSSLP